MWECLEKLFGGGFMPHGHCYLWTPSLVWTQVGANAFIGLAYLSISATLGYLVWRVKLPFSWVYIAFGAFILACGLTHFFDVATIWHPIYWADAGIRVVTAVASVGTAVLLVPLVPKVLAIARLSELAKERGEKLEVLVQELTRANERLSQQQEEGARLAAENATLTERARTQAFQERFLAILGHDLRNPLAAIAMGTGLLRQTASDGERRILNRMDSSARRMSRMVEQILDFTRSRLGGGLEVRPAPGDLGASILQVVEEVKSAYPNQAIELRAPAVLDGQWDRDRLEQILSNLVSNAASYGLPDRPVIVEAHEADRAVTIVVHNEGPAIPADLRDRLFDPFRRGPRESRTSATAGLGLGLFISREIAIAHGGSLEVESSAAEGTTFRLTVPRSPVNP